MFYEFHTGLLTYLKFTSDLPNKFTEGTDLSIALSLKYKCQERDSLDKWKNAFHFSFKAFVLLSSSLSKFVFLLTNINQQHMLCWHSKKRFFNPLVQLKELPLLNRNKKELITTACEQLSSTEGAPTVTRSLVSLRSSFDLELTARREILKNPISCPVLRT